jgi:hypothetical protein
LASKLQTNEQVVRKTFPANVITLELKDGSRLTATSFTVAKGQGVCRVLEQENDLTLPLDSIASVRLSVRNLPEVQKPPADWLRLAVPNAGGDRLIVGNPGSFDVYTGILGDVTAETISFTVDGEVLPVPRRKVFGLDLHAGTPAATKQPLAALSLWTGTRCMISDIQLKDNDLTWQTTTGLSFSMPLDMMNEIDFDEKGVAFLFDLEQVRSTFSLPVESTANLSQVKLLQSFYESRAKNSSREVVLDGVAYNRGITLLGKTTLEYQVSRPYTALRAVIGVEDQYRPNAAVNLQIMADAQVLGTWELRGDTASQRILLTLPKNCRVIKIVAEPLPQSNTPAVLTIADAKLFE